MTANPWHWWSAERIAQVTGATAANVRENWPLIANALERRGVWDRQNALGVIPTVAIETDRTFRPLHEYGTPADWADYSGGARYAGRGYIQLTHDYNYRAAGDALGIDLLGNPDRAMEPAIAADVLAWYWSVRSIPSKDGTRRYSLPELCREGDWYWVRKAVQGGTDGLDRLISIVTALGEEPAAMMFDPNTPTELQRQDWTCSIRSVMWMLKSMGIDVTAEEAQDAMSPQYVRSDVGLLDASGAGIVSVLRDRWGVGSVNDASATFDEVAALAGRQPVALGLRNWGGPGYGHWSAVRRYDPISELLILANPGGTGPKFGHQTLNREQFDARGPASMVTVPIGAAPPITVDPRDARIAELEAQVASLRSTLGYLTVDVAGALQAAVNTLGAHKPAA